MRQSVWCVLVAGVVVAGAADGPAAWAESVVARPHFSATPAELLAHARATPAIGDWPVTLLREEHEIAFDERGRSRQRWRFVFVVRTQAGVDDWGKLTHEWHPFYQDRPTIRLRVIAPDGTVSTLDQALVTDAPAVATSPSVFSDQRELGIPLPRLQIGAIVEEEIVTQDRVPLLGAGVVELRSLDRGMPLASLSITLSAPSASKATTVARHLPTGVGLRKTTSGGRDTWSMQRDAIPARPDEQPHTPGDAMRAPYVGIATGASWPAVARAYRALVDQRITEGPVTLPAGLPRSPTLATVREIVAWLHREVRYTGIEYGEASITPWTPAETLKRGFGDCKDKATLLVALLRQAGLRADLALLSTGPGFDVDAALPGMGGFDHAIVRARVAGADVWIDATEDLHVVGTLPVRDQARRALVVADDTRALTLTPRPRASEVVVREVRTFEIAELGAARVTELSHEGGPFEAGNRAWIRDTRAEEVRDNLRDYAGTEYAGTLGSYTTSAPSDLATPFAVTTITTASNRAFTEREHLEVRLFPGDVLAKLPEALTEEDDDAPTRTTDLELRVPHTYEIENRLVLPTGFELPTPAAEVRRAIGTMTYTERQRLDGRTLIVTFGLDTGTGRFTPAELARTRTAITALLAERRVLGFDTTSAALAERGQLRAAVAEAERMVAAHPTEALHHTQLASILLRAGAGPAARRAARRAVALEPRNADAHVVLAWTLRTDTFGREYGFDADRPGALAALAKARTLDPTHVGAPHDHAMMLERDRRGRLTTDRADIHAAVEAWRAAHTLDPTTDTTVGLINGLLRDGQAAEAETVAKAAEASPQRDSLYVAAAVRARGPAAGISLAAEMRSGAARAQLLQAVAATMMLYGAYDDMRALNAHSSAFSQGSAQAALVQRLRRAPAPGAARDPRTAVASVIYAILMRDPVPGTYWDAATERAITGTIHDPNLAQLQVLGPAFMRDLASSLTEIELEGRPAGPWRASVTMMGSKFALYLALDRGTAKVIGGTEYLVGLGQHARRLLAAKDEAGARQCLDWAVAGLAATAGAGPMVTWGTGHPTDAAAITLAAAQLARDVPAIPVLERCTSLAPTARAACDERLLDTLGQAARWDALGAHIATMLTRSPGTEHARLHLMRRRAMIAGGRYDVAEVLIAEALATTPDDARALRDRATNLAASGRTLDAIKVLDTVVAGPTATDGDRNQAAWLRVSERVDLPAALELARTATRTVKVDDNILHTLAMIEAELDDLRSAQADGLRSMELGGRTTPDAQDWLLAGRRWEQLGLRDDAIMAYRRATATVPTMPPPTSPSIARAALTRLGVK